MRRICIDLPDELMGAVQRLAGKKGLSPPAWVIYALAERVEAEDGDTRAERRKYPRIAVGVRGRMRLNDGQITAAASVLDISMGGVMVSLEQANGVINKPGDVLIKEGDVFELVFTLPGSNRPVLLHCKATRRNSRYMSIGAKLLAAEWDSMTGLNAFVENTITSAGATV